MVAKANVLHHEVDQGGNVDADRRCQFGVAENLVVGFVFDVVVVVVAVEAVADAAEKLGKLLNGWISSDCVEEEKISTLYIQTAEKENDGHAVPVLGQQLPEAALVFDAQQLAGLVAGNLKKEKERKNVKKNQLFCV